MRPLTLHFPISGDLKIALGSFSFLSYSSLYDTSGRLRVTEAQTVLLSFLTFHSGRGKLAHHQSVGAVPALAGLNPQVPSENQPPREKAVSQVWMDKSATSFRNSEPGKMGAVLVPMCQNGFGDVSLWKGEGYLWVDDSILELDEVTCGSWLLSHLTQI